MANQSLSDAARSSKLFEAVLLSRWRCSPRTLDACGINGDRFMLVHLPHGWEALLRKDREPRFEIEWTALPLAAHVALLMRLRIDDSEVRVVADLASGPLHAWLDSAMTGQPLQVTLLPTGSRRFATVTCGKPPPPLPTSMPEPFTPRGLAALALLLRSRDALGRSANGAVFATQLCWRPNSALQ